VETIRNAYQTQMGTELVIDGCMCGNDARLWRNIADCPTVIYGPGGLAQCHGIDEWVSVEDYLNVILVYAELILEWGSK